MKRRTVLRPVSLAMFLVAVVFVAIALSNPALGSVFYIGPFRIGADVWRAFYAAYAIVMAALFVLSFVPSKKHR